MRKRIVSLECSAKRPDVRFVGGPLDPIPLGSVPIRLEIISKEITVLCPVDKLNNLPKGLAFNVQGDFSMENNFEHKHGLITKEGITYVWNTAIHRLY